MPGHKGTLDPKFIAAVDLIRRSGALTLQVRYQDDPEPVVWMVVAEHQIDRRGLPSSGKAEPSEKHYTVGAGMHPLRAALMCAETLIDGGTCAHCMLPSILDTHDDMFRVFGFCVIRYDADDNTYRQGCGGNPGPDPADPRGFDVT